jgi:hypothetical protein
MSHGTHVLKSYDGNWFVLLEPVSLLVLCMCVCVCEKRQSYPCA